MPNRLFYILAPVALSFEGNGQSLLQTQASVDVTRQNPAVQTTPLPQEEMVPSAYWKKVHRQLWRRSQAGSNRFLQTTPRPTLDPWGDHQPFFTALGDRILKDVSWIRAPPTQTPPPTQQSVNNVLGGQCPELIIPQKLRIEVPPCNADVGHWLNPHQGLTPMMSVQNIGCSDLSLTELLGPNSTSSAHVGTLHEEFTFAGSTYDFKDCAGQPAFKITEFIIRQGVEDPERQESYADPGFSLPHRTTVFLKYSIAEPNGRIVGETNIFPMGEDSFWWHTGNHTGHVAPRSAAVASARRVGFWNPKQCGNWTKAWSLKFNESKIHNNSMPQVHWRLAVSAAMTILAWRDEQRSPDGLVRAYEGCAVENAVVFWVLFIFALLIPIAIFLYIWIKGAREAREFCFDLESWLLPHISAKPSKSRKH